MATTNISKNKQGYGYKYTDLAQIHEYLEENKIRYYQYIETLEGRDYIMTVPIIDGVEQKPRRGVQIVDAVLNGIKNPAQEQGSATTYARRYSLLMAFGLATEDDDGASLTRKQDNNEEGETIISETKAKALESSIANNNIADEEVFRILNKYSYGSTREIKIKDYMKIVAEFQKLTKKEG